MLCPRGHFIADVWLEVPDGEDAIAMWPRGRQKRSIFDHHAGWYGFWMSIARSNVLRREQHLSDPAQSWKCTNSRCHYSGWFRYESLALELAAAALAGRTKHRLAT